MLGPCVEPTYPGLEILQASFTRVLGGKFPLPCFRTNMYDDCSKIVFSCGLLERQPGKGVPADLHALAQKTPRGNPMNVALYAKDAEYGLLFAERRFLADPCPLCVMTPSGFDGVNNTALQALPTGMQLVPHGNAEFLAFVVSHFATICNLARWGKTRPTWYDRAMLRFAPMKYRFPTCREEA